jgi:hypothetical protein
MTDEGPVDDALVVTREKPRVVQHSPDHKSEYFYEKGIMMVRETFNGRTREIPLDEALIESGFAWLKAFYGPEPQ